MRIGFDAKRVFFNNSGLGNYSRGVVELLAKYYTENEYTLFSPRMGNPLDFHIPDGVEVFYPQGVMNRKLSSLWRSCNMSGALRSRNIQIFHGLSNELPMDIKRSASKSILTMHDIIFVHFPELYKPFDRYMYEKKYKASCLKADKIIAISIQTKDDLVNVWGIQQEKIDVVYQGCSPMFYDKADDKTKTTIKAKYSLPDNYILSVGTIEERKNLMLAVKAVVEGRIDIDIVACGRHTPYADKIMEYATKNGISNRLHFIHNLTFSELPAIYQMAEVMVYTSIYEGFGIPILEGLNSRIPVITSRGGVFPETGGNAAYYIDSSSTDEMIVALNRTLSDTSLRESMIEKGANYALNFRDEKVASNIYQCYKKLDGI